MTSRQFLRVLFTTLAVTAGAAWLLKIVLIAASGGTVTGGGHIGVLWLVGTVAFLLAAATGTALLLARLPWWGRLFAGVAAVPLAFVLLNVLDVAAKSVYRSDGWFRDELSLVVAGTVMALVGVRAAPRRRGQLS